MGAELWGAAGVILTAVVAFAGHMLLRPKIMAEARKAVSESKEIDWTRFDAEIERLDRKIAKLELEIDSRATREIELVGENRSLRNKVMRLERRVAGLERIFNIAQITPEMQAELDKLNRDL